VHSKKINGGMWLNLYKIVVVDCLMYLSVSTPFGVETDILNIGKFENIEYIEYIEILNIGLLKY